MSGCQYYDNADRLRELTEADKDGRCVVLPCKVGDIIYRVGNTNSWEITQILIYQDEAVFIDDSENYFGLEDFGKTVFLTREAAEAALEAHHV